MAENKTIEMVYEQSKYQIISAVNKIASKNNLPSFLVAILLKEISMETSNTSLGMVIAQNELVPKELYNEFLEFSNNQNDKEQ